MGRIFLEVGLSHKVEFKEVPGITYHVLRVVLPKISGIDKNKKRFEIKIKSILFDAYSWRNNDIREKFFMPSLVRRQNKYNT